MSTSPTPTPIPPPAPAWAPTPTVLWSVIGALALAGTAILAFGYDQGKQQAALDNGKEILALQGSLNEANQKYRDEHSKLTQALESIATYEKSLLAFRSALAERDMLIEKMSSQLRQNPGCQFLQGRIADTEERIRLLNQSKRAKALVFFPDAKKDEDAHRDIDVEIEKLQARFLALTAQLSACSG